MSPDARDTATLMERILYEVKRVVVGQDRFLERVLVALLAEGHLLVEGVRHDMAALADGAPLPALGEGSACDHCAARGLCRKDFWKA